LWPAARERSRRREAARAALLFAAAAVLGVLLAAVQLFPFAEYLFESVAWRARLEAPRHAAHAVVIGWRSVTLLLPGFFGSPARGDYWGGMSFNAIQNYVGIPTLVLAACAARARLKERETRFLLAAGVGFFFVALRIPGIHDVLLRLPVLCLPANDRLWRLRGCC